MSFTNEDEKYMRMALREAQKAFDEKEIPIGCVIVTPSLRHIFPHFLFPFPRFNGSGIGPSFPI